MKLILGPEDLKAEVPKNISIDDFHFCHLIPEANKAIELAGKATFRAQDRRTCEISVTGRAQ